jgi:hypothetical protein
VVWIAITEGIDDWTCFRCQGGLHVIIICVIPLRYMIPIDRLPMRGKRVAELGWELYAGLSR